MSDYQPATGRLTCPTPDQATAPTTPDTAVTSNAGRVAINGLWTMRLTGVDQGRKGAPPGVPQVRTYPGGWAPADLGPFAPPPACPAHLTRA